MTACKWHLARQVLRDTSEYHPKFGVYYTLISEVLRGVLWGWLLFLGLFLPLPLSKRIMLLLLILTAFGRPPLPPGCAHAKEYPLIALNFVNFILCPYYLRELWFRTHTGVRHFWPPFPPLNHNLTSLHILLCTHPPLLPRLRTY